MLADWKGQRTSAKTLAREHDGGYTLASDPKRFFNSNFLAMRVTAEHIFFVMLKNSYSKSHYQRDLNLIILSYEISVDASGW